MQEKLTLRKTIDMIKLSLFLTWFWPLPKDLVIFELENFCKLIKPDEEAICQQYIDKYAFFCGGCMTCIYLFVFVIIAAPVALDQPFPTNAEYPFDIYHQPVRSILFIHQSICALQTAAHLCLNFFTAFLLLFTSARFELLIKKLRAVTNIYDLMKCVQEHQKLLKYAEQVAYLIRPYALITITFSTFGLIIIGLIFITDQPLPMKIECISLACSGLSEVIMYTWPAEHLIEISSKMGEAIYDIKWYGQSLELQRSLQIILMRSQKPTTIAISGIMPSLSLNYYASYISTILSYFTTLRVFMQSNQDVN
ncbi:odorant receptor 67c-like [Odontomachus brunneus]|uniref:odorant receptor 67c-like n=1 Tax=Odontomachus brunneus TaxID=486640 RepID=UPI0013F21126|nr:odorant receptor 67c-like [Odontomachus brunneus]